MPKILLVAKPWKGGLARYVLAALEEMFPAHVRFLPTYPANLLENIIYRQNKKKWKEKLIRNIEAGNHDIAIFINHLPEFDQLPYRDTNMVWLTDGPKPQQGELGGYGRIFLSDRGYEADILDVIDKSRYCGVLPFAHLPSMHKPGVQRSSKKDLCFVGNRDSKRDDYLEKILAAGLKINVIGNYFLHHELFWRHPGCIRPSVKLEKLAKIYAGYRISLNIHAGVVRCGTNMRTFECAAFGIPQLIEYRPGIEDYFEPESEIALFTSPQELIEKADKMLTQPQELAKMAEKALQRVKLDHTYEHRLKTMLQEI